MARKQNLKSKQLERWDKEFLWHPFTQHYIWEKTPTLIINSGKGIYFRDTKGRRYLDGVSSLWVNIHGHNNPSLNAAVRNQLKKIAHSTFLGLSHPSAILLGKKLISVAPKGLRRVFYSDNGATAVEVALKMAFQYWLEVSATKKVVRKEFLTLRGSYHGDTLGSVSVGGIGSFHSKFKPLLFKSQFAMAPACVGCPYNRKKVHHRFRVGQKVSQIPKPGNKCVETGCRWECLSDVQRILKKRSKHLVAGIIEPVVQGAGGMIVMPEGYVRGYARLLKQYNIPIIVDEVATGFGRTGRLFSVEQENVKPDFLCVAKGLTGGYSPLAATLTTEKIFNAFKAPIQKGKTFFHGHSYTAHPLGAAVAVANLDLIEKRKLLEKTRQKAKLMKDELEALLGLPMVGSVRQAGLMAGIQLVRNSKTLKPFPHHRRVGAHICQKLLKHGIWIRPLGDTLVLMPPLAISAQEIRHLVRSVRSVILHEIKT